MGLHDEQKNEWERLLSEKGLISWILYPNLCCRCGALWPEMFRVPNEEWKRYVEPRQQRKMICQPCYDWIKCVVDEAKKVQRERTLTQQDITPVRARKAP